MTPTVHDQAGEERSAKGQSRNSQQNQKRDAEKEARGLQREFRSYVWGISLALVTTAIPFALVHWAVLPRFQALVVTGVFALIQVICHFRFFLHVDLRRQKREDLQLILFSGLLLLLMAGGTVWIIANLASRMSGHSAS
jgi:cytochrome o ubiquinol oxidase operon protein cyoD